MFIKYNYRTNNQRNTCIKLSNVDVEEVNCYTYLGFNIDNKLKYTNQYNHVLGKIKSCNFILSRASIFLPNKTLLTLYKSIDLPHILYNKFVLITLSNSQINKLQNKLNTTECIIYNKSEPSNMLEFNLNHILNYYCCLFIFKMHPLKFSGILNQLVPFISHCHMLRKKSNLCVFYINNNICKKAFWYIALKL